MRLVAVLGYSHPRWHEIHDICAERVRHAETLKADAVLLSGEVDHMRPAWNGSPVPLLLDPDARSTRENALGVADAARRLKADDVVVVTSRWHALRARTLVRAALPGVAVTSSSPAGRPPVALLGREVACLAALPIQLLRVRLRR
ncbi:MAG TPA: ElyC/SanA/YdcF family protein [Gaiellaceae bacterium]